MNINRRRLFRTSGCATAILLGVVILLPAFGAETAAAIAGVRVSGNHVTVLVTTATPSPCRVVVTISGQVAGRIETVSAPVVVSAGEPAVVDFALPGPLTVGMPLGVVLDDGSPF